VRLDTLSAVIQDSYPILHLPEQGTVLYPYREDCRHEVSRLKARFCQWLGEQMPEGLTFRNDVGICVSDELPLICPDLVIWVDGHPEVRIAVEIDEPFNPCTREPQHYLTGGDNYRDGLLTRLGWTVVRFAERQVWNHHKACADYLIELLKARVPNLVLPKLSEETLPSVKRWTRMEAQRMAVGVEAITPSQTPNKPVRCWPMTTEERQGMSQVRPLPRTRDMQEKMAHFRDAGRYEQDAYIDFEPYEHIYIYKGRQRLLPVSSLVGYFFEEFNALAVAERQWQNKGIPIDKNLEQWDRNGAMASEVGTFVHAQTENFFRDGTFETVYPFCYNGQTEMISVEKEKQYFLQFVSDYAITPYRQEWPVYDTILNVAGTIDLICQESDGTFTIYDWKRSSKVVNFMGQPITEGFNGKMSLNGINLPDTPFYHYCLQQNLYRYMLETHYGIRVRAMNLVVLCASYPSYYVAQVPKMDEVVSQMIGICQKEDLGHRLLT